MVAIIFSPIVIDINSYKVFVSSDKRFIKIDWCIRIKKISGSGLKELLDQD